MSIDTPNLLRAAGGHNYGKVRLQKIVYLLDSLKMKSDYGFEYHHYGPYSAELAADVDDSIAFGHVVEETGRRANDGVPYSIFRASPGRRARTPGRMRFADAEVAIRTMNAHSATVLELAATIHWLVNIEGEADWRDELQRRKGVKTAEGRTNEALTLLRDLGLAPEH